jgi:hypothetical protein
MYFDLNSHLSRAEDLDCLEEIFTKEEIDSLSNLCQLIDLLGQMALMETFSNVAGI